VKIGTTREIKSSMVKIRDEENFKHPTEAGAYAIHNGKTAAIVCHLQTVFSNLYCGSISGAVLNRIVQEMISSGTLDVIRLAGRSSFISFRSSFFE